jgi:FAD:protein FMN transferase
VTDTGEPIDRPLGGEGPEPVSRARGWRGGRAQENRNTDVRMFRQVETFARRYEMRIPRRRALLITAATASMALLGRLVPEEGYEWTGTALGADARLLLFGAPAGEAEAAVRACCDEIARLEQIFSLYLASSEIVALNAVGRRQALSPELIALLRICRHLGELTGGLFEPAIQPLWQAYAEGFGRHGPDFEIEPDELRRLIARSRIAAVRIGDRHVEMPEGGALTLNGIAQGFITDRIADLLRRRGYRNVLLDIGEVRALGRRPEGGPFTIAVREGALHLPLADAAMATSAPEALVFSREKGISHILDPRTGLTPSFWRSVTVRHPSATIADGLSTALCLAPVEAFARILGAVPGCHVWAVGRDATVDTFSS